MYQQTKRIPQHKRYFKGKFDKSGYLVVKEKNMPVNLSDKATSDVSNSTSRFQLTAILEEDFDETKYALKFINFVKDQQSYDRINFYKGWIFLATLLATYLYLVKKNSDLQVRINSRVKSKKQEPPTLKGQQLSQ